MRSDDEHAVALLQSLNTEPPSASTIDIAKAMTEGRHRRRRHHIVAGGASTLGALALILSAPYALDGIRQHTDSAQTRNPIPPSTTGQVSPSPSAYDTRRVEPDAPAECVISRLPEPEGAYQTLVSGADPTGRYIVGRSYERVADGPLLMPVIWDNGELREVDMPGIDQWWTDVNSSGTAVGTSAVGGSEHFGWQAWAYDQGKVVRLPGGPGTTAEGISEAGTIAGSVARHGAKVVETHAAIWPSPTSQPVELPMPNRQTEAHAVDIDDDGTVIGKVGFWAWIWRPDGTYHELTMPDGKRISDVYSIRGGWVVGRTPFEETVRLNVHTGQAEVLSRFAEPATAVNVHGWLAGAGGDRSGILLTRDGEVALPGLTESTGILEPWDVSPVTISDDGRTIAGNHDDADDDKHAVVWRCR